MFVKFTDVGTVAFWGLFSVSFLEICELNLDIIDFTGNLHARAKIFSTFVPTLSFEAIK